MNDIKESESIQWLDELVEKASASVRGKKKYSTPEEINPKAFTPYPPISHPDELWKPDFPRPDLPSTASTADRVKKFHIDIYDYNNARARERMIYIEETTLWYEKLQKCKELSGPGLEKNIRCRPFDDIYRERIAYINSRYSKYRIPLLSPALPDLGPKPSPPVVEDPVVKDFLDRFTDMNATAAGEDLKTD